MPPKASEKNYSVHSWFKAKEKRKTSFGMWDPKAPTLTAYGRLDLAGFRPAGRLLQDRPGADSSADVQPHRLTRPPSAAIMPCNKSPQNAVVCCEASV